MNKDIIIAILFLIVFITASGVIGLYIINDDYHLFIVSILLYLLSFVMGIIFIIRRIKECIDKKYNTDPIMEYRYESITFA